MKRTAEREPVIHIISPLAELKGIRVRLCFPQRMPFSADTTNDLLGTCGALDLCSMLAIVGTVLSVMSTAIIELEPWSSSHRAHLAVDAVRAPFCTVALLEAVLDLG